MNKIILLIISTALLISCSGFKDAGKVLRNEKITTTDEFLIKKRDPLVLPPDFREIPKPKSQSNQTQNFCPSIIGHARSCFIASTNA